MSAAITPLTMPKWGIEMTEGTINAWRVAAGQAVSKGEPLLDVETDKIVNSVEAPADGTVRRLIGDAGEVRPVGSLLGVIASPEISEGEIDTFVASFRGARVSFEPDAEVSGAPAAVESEAADASGEARVSPIARRVAEKLGVDLALVRGTGRAGRISKEDVEAYVAARAGDNPSTRKRMSATRVTIAARLLHSSQSIPHYRLAATVIADTLLNLKRELEARSVRVSLNALVLRAAALALVKHRALNARLEEPEIVEYENVDVAIGVASDNGLLTPVLRRANLKSVEEIATESADLITRARRGALTRGDLEGGTFTLSNLGMFGVERFDAIINPPQVAILAVGSAQRTVVVREEATAVATTMTLTLSVDHRVIDGAVAARFLATLRTLIEAGDGL